MNSRIEKLCLSRHQRDPIWKFWQPNAKLEKIHPPIYWKSLDYKKLNLKKKINNKNHTNKCSYSDGCDYTTLIGNEYHIFVDYKHNGLQHATWKESIEYKHSDIKSKPLTVESSWLNLSNNNKQQSLNDRSLINQELYRYFKSHIQKDNLFQIDKTPYPNRPIPISRRPRDVLHIDFYQANHLKDSKIEATFKTFYHRKYLLSRHLHEQTLKDLLSIAINIQQFNIEIIGHFILHPNELSKHEIQMFGLTSTFGDIYEGHIIRINKEKLVLLLASTYHSHIRLSQIENLKNIPDEPKSTIEEILLNHVREYLQIHTNHSMKQIHRIQIELEPLINQEKRRVIIHLLSNDEIIENLTFEITFEQEPKLFQKEFENEFYFLQTIDEQIIISTVENKLKQLFNKRYLLIHQNQSSYIQLTLDIEYETMHNIETMFYAYMNNKLSKYSREECMRIAIEYSFDDLLDQLDSNEIQMNKINLMIEDIQIRLRSQIERRLQAEATAKILLMGPPMKKEIESTDNEVIVLDHHRTIFIARSDTDIGPSKVKDIQRNHGHVTFHEEIDGGPKCFHRLPMSIDSLTILTRIQQRKHLASEQNKNHFTQLGSGIHRLITTEDQAKNHSLSIECEQDKIEDNHSIKTTSIDTKSYNTSAHTKQKFYRVKRQQRKTRTPAEYGKYRQKRKKYKRYTSIMKSLDNNINPKCSFFENLFLLQQNKKPRNRIQKDGRSSKHVNTNAIIKNDEQTSNASDESIEQQSFHDEGFQDKEINEDDDLEASEKSYLRSLYGSLSPIMKHVHEIYQSKSSQLLASLDLAHIFIAFLHIRKDVAYEIASTIIAARQRLIQPISTEKSSSSTIIESKMHINEENDDDISDSSGIISAEDSDTLISENDSISRSINDHEDKNHFSFLTNRKKYNLYTNKNIGSSNSQYIMSRIISYLSKVDWRVYNYITKHFLQNGGMITSHALEFSSALLIDLIEDSVYRTYFHLKWCSNSSVNLNHEKTNEDVKDIFIEQFIKKSIDNLLNHLQLINLPLLENIALMHTLKNYMSTDILQEFNTIEPYPVPIDREPCIWFSTDILIKTICLLTDDILNKMNHDYLSDYTKFEYLLVSYFRKIEIIQNLQDTIEKKQSQMTSTSSHNSRYLLHVIDLNQAPKFFSNQAFKRFQLGENSYLNGDIEALKDLVLLDIQKHNIKSVQRPYLPLNVDDLVLRHQNRVINPSSEILAQYHRRWATQKTRLDKYNIQKDLYQFDETIDSTKRNNLPPEVQALLNNMIRNYGTVEENLAMHGTQDQYGGLSEKDIAQLIEDAIEAVQRFDRDNNIGDRKLQNKKTVNDRLTEFFKYAGRHGVRVLDNVLKLAKLRSNDPKKYLPLAVNMLKDRLKQSGTTHMRKRSVSFAHTIETLLTATNENPELITKLLKKKSSANKLDLSRKITNEVHENADISSIESITDTNIPSYPTKMTSTDKYRQTLPILEESAEPTIPSNYTTEIDDKICPELLLFNSIIPQIGLTVAQMIVLTTVQNQKPLKLTDTQIKQMCMKQDHSKEQWQVYVKKLMETTEISDKFLLTEEQLVQIAIEENISIEHVEHIGTLHDHFQLNESQVRSLITQINMVNCTLSSFTRSLEQQQSPLFLHLDQFIDLCNQLNINIDKLLDHKRVSQKSSLIDTLKFTLTSAQIAYLINQAKFDIKKLITIEQDLKKHNMQAQQFCLSSSQLAYLLANRRVIHGQYIAGLSFAQLIALYVLPQQAIKDEQTFSFSLTYQQIKQLALSQNMTLAHFQSLSSSKKPFQLTRDQLIYITSENKTSMQQIVSMSDDQKSNVLDRQQFCSLINQHNQSSTPEKSSHTIPSIDESHRIQERVCLNVEQIVILAKYSDIKLHQLTACLEEYTDIKEFRLKPEQLAMLWTTSTSSNDLKHITSLPESPADFTMSDEQFSSLLHSVSPSVLSKHSQLIKSGEPINVTQTSSNDTQNRLPSTLTNQLTAMHERLKSSVQAHAETMNIVSNSMLNRNHIESTLNLVHQLSLHSIDDISNKEVETIPSFVLDLLKMNTITENMYNSIKQGEITTDMLDKSVGVSAKSKEITDLIANKNINKTIIEQIQTNQLTFPQIHKIQTQLLTPKLIEQFKSGSLSQHILDAYKSLSPLQIINKVRSSVTQLNTLLLQQSPIISQSDDAIVSIMQQTATNNPTTTTTNEMFNVDVSNIEKQILPIEQSQLVDILPKITQQEPITIYPESAIVRQEILQELRNRLNTQRIELKKEYNIEPVKGKASIQQITNKLRTMTVIQDLETLIGRQIDEVDILNILEGHLNHLLVQVPVHTNELFDRNVQHRINRINERIQLVNLLQNHIENERLKRQMTLEEFTALILEDIPKFEQLTNLHLTEDDLRIISMNRFTSLEQSLNRSLTESEFRHLLQTDSPLNYIEQELLKRSLTIEERIEQEELTLLLYQELVHNKASISYGKITESLEKQNIKLNRAQLEQILERRAELVDQYDLLYSISPIIKQIEQELNRSLTIDEKKRLIHDDYSMIKQTKDSKSKDMKEKSLPITASLIELVENTQDKNLLENIKHLENNLERSLTKQELITVAQGDIINLEKTLKKSLSVETIKSMYNNRFTDLTNELHRDLTDKEIRDILSGKLSNIEKALGRQLTSTERLTYKPVNIIDMTGSQLIDTQSIDTTIQELEDVLERRLTSHEIQHLTDQQINLSNDKLNIIEKKSIDLHEDDSFISNQPIRFTLSEIEKAIGKSLNSDELKRFADSRFVQIENDLGKSLNDLQRSNLLKGDKLTIESLINRKLSSKETGPHLVNLINIERILNRSLTYDELINLSGDRFDDIHQILQRSLKYEELIDLLNGNNEKMNKLIEEKLDQQKEIELNELPINRIRYFENILQRKLSPNELLRFAEDRFETLLRLLSDVMKPEQILDLCSGHYDKIEGFFNRRLTLKEKYELDKNLLENHLKYSTKLDEIEYLIQRRLSEGELRNFVEDKFYDIEKRLGKKLTEKQIRNIFLHGIDDQSLVDVKDLLNIYERNCENDRKRTQKIVNHLIEKLDKDYHEQKKKESIIRKSLKPSSRISLIQEKPSNIEFHQSTNDLLERLSDDVRKHAVDTSEEILDDISEISNDEFEQQSTSDQEITPIHQNESIKAFENVPRIVEHITDKEHIEEMNTINDAIDKFQEKIPKTVKTTISNETTSTWLSTLDRRSTTFHLPVIKSIEDRLTIHESHLTEIHPEEDIYLGWTLFKGVDRPDLGLKEEKPLMINVKHQAQTYVVGIPEEYADEKSKIIANKIYQGGLIVYQSSKTRVIKDMSEFVSQLFQIPIINDATHFIVPSRAYIDIIEATITYQSEIIGIENNELQMCDSRETLEWYEECIQRNIQVHAHIPMDYQPSIIYCHTGRRTIITPAKRSEQRKASTMNSTQKSKSELDKQEENIPTFNSDSFQKFIQSNELPSNAQTVTDLIMHTVTTSQKADLLEALDELFSQENLDKYQMTETHWQDIFLILLNSYLRSHALNRKEIFQRLTDKLNELRINQQQHSSEFYPSISISSPLFIKTPNSLNEIKPKQFHLGLRSSPDSINSSRSLNESDYNITPTTTGQPSIASHESMILLSNNNLSTQFLLQNHSPVPISAKNVDSRSDIKQVLPSSMENINENSSETKPHISMNSNAMIGHQCSSIPMKHRRYKITVMHNDTISDTTTNKCKTASEFTKLPSIVSKTKRSTTTTTLTDNHLLLSSSTSSKRFNRNKMFFKLRNK